MDVIPPSALVAPRRARVTRAGHGGGDVLHSVDTKRQRNRDKNAERKQSSRRARNFPTKRGRRKPAHLVRHRHAEGNRERRGLSGPRRRVLRPRERVERVARWPRKAKKTHGQAWAWTMLEKPCQKVGVLGVTQLQTALLGKTRKNEDRQTWSSTQKRIPRQG